jgi:hypothetical protein
MICQISTVKNKTEPLPDKGLLQARRIQAKLKERVADGLLPEDGQSWSPITAGPYLVPVTRWVE